MANEVYEPDVLRLTDENGKEFDYEILDVVEYDGEEYAVLFSTDENADDGAVILKILPAAPDEPETYVGVDENTMNAVFSLFREIHKDELA